MSDDMHVLKYRDTERCRSGRDGLRWDKASTLLLSAGLSLLFFAFVFYDRPITNNTQVLSYLHGLTVRPLRWNLEKSLHCFKDSPRAPNFGTGNYSAPRAYDAMARNDYAGPSLALAKTAGTSGLPGGLNTEGRDPLLPLPANAHIRPPAEKRLGLRFVKRLPPSP